MVKIANSLWLTFNEFAFQCENDFNVSNMNLYIVWRNDRSLYVGSSHHIWDRWFRHVNSHLIYFDGQLSKPYSSIGKAIYYNIPESFNWEIELRNFNVDNIHKVELAFIEWLTPLFNIAGTKQKLSDEDIELHDRLLSEPK